MLGEGIKHTPAAFNNQSGKVISHDILVKSIVSVGFSKVSANGKFSYSHVSCDTHWGEKSSQALPYCFVYEMGNHCARGIKFVLVFLAIPWLGSFSRLYC